MWVDEDDARASSMLGPALMFENGMNDGSYGARFARTCCSENRAMMAKEFVHVGAA